MEIYRSVSGSWLSLTQHTPLHLPHCPLSIPLHPLWQTLKRLRKPRESSDLALGAIDWPPPCLQSNKHRQWFEQRRKKFDYSEQQKTKEVCCITPIHFGPLRIACLGRRNVETPADHKVLPNPLHQSTVFTLPLDQTHASKFQPQPGFWRSTERRWECGTESSTTNGQVI